jgi:transcriptional regulator with XRE-family HTH domain
MNVPTVGEKIKQLRRKNNIQQYRLAEYLNVTNGAISNWENNRRLPSIEELKKIAECFNVSLDYFSNGDYALRSNETRIDEPREKTVVFAYQYDRWSFSTINRLLLVASSTSLFVSALVQLNTSIVFFFYGFYALVSYIVLTFIQYERQRENIQTVEFEESDKLVYRHALSDELIQKRRKHLLIYGFLSAIITSVFISLFLFLLYRLDYFALFMILIIYFIALSIAYYYQFNLLYHQSALNRTKPYENSQKGFKSYIFKVLLLLHIANMLLVSSLFILSESDATTHLVVIMCMILAFSAFIVHFVLYIQYGNLINGYNLFITHDDVRYRPIKPLDPSGS